jgi:hypothetical protein
LSNHLRHCVSHGYPVLIRKSYKESVHNADVSKEYLADPRNLESPYRRKKDWLGKFMIHLIINVYFFPHRFLFQNTVYKLLINNLIAIAIVFEMCALSFLLTTLILYFAFYFFIYKKYLLLCLGKWTEANIVRTKIYKDLANRAIESAKT